MHMVTSARVRRNGFTLVEIIVSVVIIAILASIAVVSYVVQQRETRDSQRDSRVLTISEALEKYYDENGEYPSCSALSGTAAEVSDGVLVGIDQEALAAPSDTSGSANSISCADLTSVTQGDYYAYVGDSSANCQTGNACLVYTLKYIDEVDGTIKTIESRNMTDIATSGMTTLTVAETGFYTANADWTPIENATGYNLQRATDSNFTQNVVDTTYSGESASITGLTADTTYYFRIQAVSASGVGDWSEVKNITTWKIGIPNITRGTETTTTVAFSWSAIDNVTNYQYQYRINGGSWVGPTTTTATAVTLTSSNGAKIEIQARSNISGTYSDWSSIVTGYLIPSTPTVTYGSVTTSSITFSWSAITGASTYQYQSRTNGGAWSSSTSQTATSRAITSTTQGTEIELQVRSVNAHGNASAWSAVTGTTLNVDGPAWNAWGHTYSYPSIVTWVYRSGGASLCPTGTTVYARYAGGVGSVGSYGSYSANGSSSETTRWTETVSSYDNVLYSQIQGYCRNTTSGAQSSTVTTGVNTTSVPKPSVSLSGNSYCTSVYPSRTAFSIELRVQETSYNLDANTSVVSWWGYRKATASGWQTYNETLTGNSYNIVIDGASVKSGTSASGRWRYSASSSGQTEALYNRSSTSPPTTSFSGSRTITHSSNGTKTINVSISDTMAQVPLGSASCSKSYTLSDLR